MTRKKSPPKKGGKKPKVVALVPKTISEPEKRPEGRPTDYRPEYCQDIIEHMSKGGSVESFGAFLWEKYGPHAVVCKQTVYNWTEKHTEFLDAKSIGETMALRYFEKLGDTGIKGEFKVLKKEFTLPDGTSIQEFTGAPFGSTAWIFNMKNRFGWRDKKEIVTSSGKNVFDGKTDEELLNESAQIKKKLAMLDEEE